MLMVIYTIRKTQVFGLIELIIVEHLSGAKPTMVAIEIF